MNTKRLLLTFLALTAGCISSFAQEMTVDEAIAKMKQTTHDYLTDAFTEKDETGADQFVDVEIVNIHDFSDFSYGSLMKEFKEYLNSLIPTYTNLRGEKVKSSRASGIEKKNSRMLEYVQANMTKLAAYAAIVDYNGITKYHEKKALSRLVFYDWKGEVISFKNPLSERNDFKLGLSPYMYKKAESELADMNDPLFLRSEFWVSDIIEAEANNRLYEMQWCYQFTKENVNDPSIDKGKFKLFYYQVQRSVLQVIKSVSIIEGLYERDDNHFWLSYKDAAVESYHVKLDEIPTFIPDYSNLDFDSMSPQLIEANRMRKMIRSLSNTPDKYNIINKKSFSSMVPFRENDPVTFHKKDNQ